MSKLLKCQVTKWSFDRVFFRLVPVRKENEETTRKPRSTIDNQEVERLRSDKIRAASKRKEKVKQKVRARFGQAVLI